MIIYKCIHSEELVQFRLATQSLVLTVVQGRVDSNIVQGIAFTTSA